MTHGNNLIKRRQSEGYREDRNHLIPYYPKEQYIIKELET